MQLASINVGKKKGQDALRYLGQLPPAEQATIPYRLLKAQALFWTGQKAQADNLIQQIQQQAPGDPRIAFSTGMAYVAMERFEEAEKAFGRALEAAPGNFEILYNLGLAATRAGHLAAPDIFLKALEKKPRMSTPFSASHVCTPTKTRMGWQLLCWSRQSPVARPNRRFVVDGPSHVRLGFHGDAATAYDKYFQLKPADDIARREREFPS